MPAMPIDVPLPFVTMGKTHGLWQFPPAPDRQPKGPPEAHVLAQIRERRAVIRAAGKSRAAALVRSLKSEGASQSELFEEQAWDALGVRLRVQSNRCPHCWHDARQQCICAAVGMVRLGLPVRVLVLMHHKEYWRASDDAKLLMMMLPPEQAKLFIFGRPGDLAAIEAELNEDPSHSMMLWPGEGAQTVEEFVGALPAESPWRRARGQPDDSQSVDRSTWPTLRVVVLDAVYRHARNMFRHLRKLRGPDSVVQHVALHPKTLSVYSRAQHGYAQASATSVAQSADPAALRICTVEAFALLLSELGEPEERTRPLIDAVVVNNHALGSPG